jgi:imidazolonepropionase-like amidohydrolase
MKRPLWSMAMLAALAMLAPELAAEPLYITGVQVHPQVPGRPRLDDGAVSIVGGVIRCVGLRQGPAGSATCPPAPGAKTLDYAGKGVLIPGLVESLGRLGLYEIDAEEHSHDGTAARQSNNAAVRALDGVALGSRAVAATRKGGVGIAVVRPQGNALITGQSVAFHTLSTRVDQALIAASVAVHVQLGQEAKRDEPLVGSRSGQMAALRDLLTRAKRLAESPKKLPAGAEGEILARLREDPGQQALGPVALGRQPLVVHAHRAEDISAALRLQKELGLAMVIAGGAEAHVVADQLAKQGVAVLLQVRVKPYDFQTLRANDGAAALLARAGVNLVLASGDSHNARNLRWEAGYAVAHGLPWQQALDGVTRVAAEVLRLPAGTATLTVGQTANLAVYDGDPLSLNSRVQLVVIGDTVEENPQQR